MNFVSRAYWVVAQDDERGRLVGSLGHAPEGAHLELFDLVGTVSFAVQADFRRHFFRTLGHHRRCHAIGGFIDQVAREVLRLGDDASGLHRTFHGLCIVRVAMHIAWHDNGDGVDLLVLLVAVAFVVARIEVADEGAFDDCAQSLARGNGGLGYDEGEAADAFAFQSTHSGAGELAQFRCRKSLGFAAADEEQPFRFQPRGAMEQRCFESLAGYFAARNHVLGSFAHASVAGFDGYNWLVFLALIFFALIKDHYDQAIGFQLRRNVGGEICIHDGLSSVSTVEGETRNSAMDVWPSRAALAVIPTNTV